MSRLRRRRYLKTKFETGDRPDANDFADLIDSSLNQKSDQIFAVDRMLGIGTKKPDAPLVIKGSNKKVKQSVVATDGANSTFRIAHPDNKVVAIGSDRNESIQLGNFHGTNCDFFLPQMYISEGGIGIGVAAKNAELDVNTTLWVGESIGLGKGTLTYKKGNLYLKANDQTYQILTEKSNGKNPFRKWRLAMIILGCIFFTLGIISIILYLINKYAQ